MKKYIFYFFAADVLGKLLYFRKELIVYLAGLLIVVGIYKLQKKIIKLLPPQDRFVPFLQISLTTGFGLIIFFVICLLLFRLLINYSQLMGVELVGFSLIVVTFFAYLSMALIFFNFVTSAIDLYIHNRNRNTLMVVIVLVIVMTEAFSAVIFYKDGYYEYKKNQFSQEIENMPAEASVAEDLMTRIRLSDQREEISQGMYEELDHSFRSKLLELDLSMNDRNLSYLSNNQSKKSDSLPNLHLFMKLFKFSFYQHYILGLDDDLMEYQKYIAGNNNLSSIQMVHIIFTRLIDLVLIGKLISLFSSKRRNENTAANTA